MQIRLLISNARLAGAGYSFRHKGMVYFLGHWGMGDTERTTTQHVSNSVQKSFVFNVNSQSQQHLSVRNEEYPSAVQLQQQLQQRHHQQQQQFGTDSSALISGFCLTKSANADPSPFFEDQQQQDQLNNCHINSGSAVGNTQHVHSQLHSNRRNSSNSVSGGVGVGSDQCCSPEFNFHHHHLHHHQYHQQQQQQQQHDTESDEDEIALYPLNNQVGIVSVFGLVQCRFS